MHQNRRVGGTLLHVVTDEIPEVDEQVSGVGHAVVGPGGEVILPQRVALTRLVLKPREEVSSTEHSCPTASGKRVKSSSTGMLARTGALKEAAPQNGHN